MKLVLALLFVPLIQSCALSGLPAAPASGNTFSGLLEVPKDKVVLYIVREKRFFQGGAYPNVSICGNTPTPLRNGGYFVSIVEPGECSIEFSNGRFWTLSTSDLQVKLEKEREYFWKFVMDREEITAIPVGGVTAAYVSGDASLVPITKNEALLLLRVSSESY
ncbi:Uncharacterised protein [Halioglobus japonicus]|nr:Uncharacterised protein [Halioglobus japonicus]